MIKTTETIVPLTTKKEMILWCPKNKVEYQGLSREDLCTKLKEIRKKYEVSMVDQAILESGKDIKSLFLPPRHPMLNPIEEG